MNHNSNNISLVKVTYIRTIIQETDVGLQQGTNYELHQVAIQCGSAGASTVVRSFDMAIRNIMNYVNSHQAKILACLLSNADAHPKQLSNANVHPNNVRATNTNSKHQSYALSRHKPCVHGK